MFIPIHDLANALPVCPSKPTEICLLSFFFILFFLLGKWNKHCTG